MSWYLLTYFALHTASPSCFPPRFKLVWFVIFFRRRRIIGACFLLFYRQRRGNTGRSRFIFIVTDYFDCSGVGGQMTLKDKKWRRCLEVFLTIWISFFHCVNQSIDHLITLSQWSHWNNFNGSWERRWKGRIFLFITWIKPYSNDDMIQSI